MNIGEIKELMASENTIMSKESIDKAVNNLKSNIDANILSALSIMAQQPVPDSDRILWDGERFISQ